MCSSLSRIIFCRSILLKKKFLSPHSEPPYSLYVSLHLSSQRRSFVCFCGGRIVCIDLYREQCNAFIHTLCRLVFTAQAHYNKLCVKFVRFRVLLLLAEELLHFSKLFIGCWLSIRCFLLLCPNFRG